MAVQIEFEAKIIEQPSVKTGTSNKTGAQWMAMEAVCEIPDEKYPSKLAFEVFGEDKINELNLCQGDVVKVKANVQSNGFNGRYFTSVKAWHVQILSKATVAPPQAPQQITASQSTQQAAPKVEEKKSGDVATDDLPF